MAERESANICNNDFDSLLVSLRSSNVKSNSTTKSRPSSFCIFYLLVWINITLKFPVQHVRLSEKGGIWWERKNDCYLRLTRVFLYALYKSIAPFSSLPLRIKTHREYHFFDATIIANFDATRASYLPMPLKNTYVKITKYVICTIKSRLWETYPYFTHEYRLNWHVTYIVMHTSKMEYLRCEYTNIFIWLLSVHHNAVDS